MGQFIRRLYNLLFNPNAVNTGGVFPNLAAPATVTAGKSYAMGAWTEIAAAASVTQRLWIYAVYAGPVYISGGARWQGELGFGAASAEVAQSGSTFLVGTYQKTDVGIIADQVWSYGAYPVFVPSGTRIAARAASSNAANDQLGVAVAYRTGLGD